jgi:uncharacterized protein YdaT
MINLELDEWELQQLQILIAKALINQDYTMGSEVLIAYNKAMKRLLRKLVESEEFAEPEEEEDEEQQPEPPRQSSTEELFLPKPAADGSVTIGNNFTNSFDSYLDKKKRQT